MSPPMPEPERGERTMEELSTQEIVGGLGDIDSGSRVEILLRRAAIYEELRAAAENLWYVTPADERQRSIEFMCIGKIIEGLTWPPSVGEG